MLRHIEKNAVDYMLGVGCLALIIAVSYRQYIIRDYSIMMLLPDLLLVINLVVLAWSRMEIRKIEKRIFNF